MGKSGFSRREILYEFSAALVNQLMSCYWMENGVEVESMEESATKQTSIAQKLKDIEERRKRIKFDF